VDGNNKNCNNLNVIDVVNTPTSLGMSYKLYCSLMQQPPDHTTSADQQFNVFVNFRFKH